MGEIVSMATLKHSSHLDTVAQWEKQGVQPRQNFLAVELFLSLLMHHYQDHDLRIRLKNDSTQRHTVTYRGKSEVTVTLCNSTEPSAPGRLPWQLPVARRSHLYNAANRRNH